MALVYKDGMEMDRLRTRILWTMERGRQEERPYTPAEDYRSVIGNDEQYLRISDTNHGDRR